MSMKNVLLIVDYQKDFVDGALGFESAKCLDAGILELAKKYVEDEDGVVICTFDTHRDDYLETREGKNLPVPHCRLDSEGWQLYGETGKYIHGLCEGEAPFFPGHENGMRGNCVLEVHTPELLQETGKLYKIEKNTFGSLPLGKLLRHLNHESGVASITIVGVVTNMCVISNAVIAKAACSEAEIIIKKDLVDSFDKEKHEQALAVMESMQMKVE